MCSQWSMRSPVTGALLSTMNLTIVSERLTTLHPPVCSWMASLTPQTTKTASASDCCPTSTATPQSRTPADTLAKVWLITPVRVGNKEMMVIKCSYTFVVQECTCTMWEGRCMQSASATPAFLFRVVTVITTTASTLPLCARSPVDVAWRFSTTKSLLNFWLSRLTMALRPSMSLPRCVQLGWALSR